MSSVSITNNKQNPLRQIPRIAIVADVQCVGTQQRYTVDRIPVDTIIRVLRAEPVVVPPIEGAIGIDDLLDMSDGFFINGGLTNIRPERYGKQASPEYGPFDEARDGFVLPLIPQILERGIPLLVTCRGFQELNVALGGTLCKERDDLPEDRKHGAPKSAQTEDERYRIRHALKIHSGGILARTMGEETVRINSLHSQLIERLAPDLVVEATAEDGTIEAARPRSASGFALGTMFHPEYWAEKDAASAAILAVFSNAVQAYAARRSPAPAAK
jgi:putative glutamine amidotransferase